MVFSNLKKNKSINYKGPARTGFRGGFALLFSVLVASLLLTIGLSIFRIALKELSISTAARQSIHAFYAADSGRECALYWDSKAVIPSLNAPNPAGIVINCAGVVHNINYSIESAYLNEDDTKITGPVTSDIGSINTPIIQDPVDSTGPNYYLEIIKAWDVSGILLLGDKIITTIKSYGQDSVGGDRVQRSIITSY